MRPLLNTLFVTTQGAYLAKEGQTVTVKVGQEVRLRVPVHTVSGIVCFGQVSCSPFLMGFCAENNVEISFLTENGRFLARVQGPVSGNVLLRREQYRKADDLSAASAVASAIVAAKVANARAVIGRTLRDHPQKTDVAALRDASERLRRRIERLGGLTSLDEIRGIEGDCGRIYFAVFRHFVTTEGEAFRFMERSRRPPLDNMNALLSFIYTLLMHDFSSAIECVGLDRQVGFLHRDRPGRAGLALDLMEEFRPFFADRLALSLVNLRQVRARGFKKSESGAVVMNDETRKEVLTAYQSRKRDEIMHPFIKEKVPVGQLFFVQALLFARFVRGDLDGYPAFFWK